MILVRGFSTETNGTWALFITLFSLFEVVKQGLIRNASIRFLGLPEYAGKKNTIQSASLLLNAVFSLIVIFMILAGGNLLATLLKTNVLTELLVKSSFLILLLIPYNHCEIILQSHYRFSTLFAASCIRYAIFFLGLLTLYCFFSDHFTLLNALLLQILALTASLVYILVKSHRLIIRRYEHDPLLIRKLFHFGKFTFFANLFSTLARSFDHLLLARSFDHLLTANMLDPLAGKNYVAYYNTVARINNMVDMPSLAAADVLYPKNVEALQIKGLDRVKYYFEQMVGTILALIIPISLFIFIFPRQIIYLIAGEEYYPAIPILQLTILFSIARPLSYQFGSTLDAIGKPHINFRVNLVFMLLSLLLTYLGIRLSGPIGAAYAAIAFYILSLFAMITILKNYIHLELRNILLFCLDRYKGFGAYTAKFFK